MIPNPDQRRAAEPATSAWVAANAGSGKTAVLTDRVARLLMAGTEPQRILCLTYTRAAAAEMQTRLFARLGAWAMLDDAPLAAALLELGEPAPALTPARLATARTLFARALDTPGGLKIQTIHAFCDALLRRFPLEAGVPPGFAVLEDRQARDLRRAALDALAERDPAVVEAMARHLSGDDPDPLLQEIARARARLAGPFDPAALARALGHEPGLDAAALAAAILDAPARALLDGLLPRLAAGAKTEARAAATLADALAAPPETALKGLEAVLLTGPAAAEPFAAKAGRFPTRATRAALGPAADALDALMIRVEAARPRRLAAAAFAKAEALQRFARGWLAALDGLKGPGLLDFDDLIDRSVALLSDPGTAAFVLWRLDGGLDHVLVDEAQDTSPAQWRVIQAITEEFFAGDGARDAERTVFVVGDEKQSIYSFQGADPAAFAAMRGHFEARLDAMERELANCALIHSYRSAAPILALVDEVFAGPAGGHLDGAVAHEPADPARPGRVELWPFLEPADRPEEPPWDRPLDMAMPDDPVARLAEAIAVEIAGWLRDRRPVPIRGAAGLTIRAVRPGDILILVQRRGTVFHPLIRALKRHRVPVAGADVLRIGGELAVRDLLAALRVAVTPGDDLALAALLRSPLGGLSEAALFDLAHGRRGTLAAALAASGHDGPRRLVADLGARGDFLRPHEMLERILIEHDGRNRLIARLGPEAEDGIDALLDQALAYEAAEPPTLTGFLAWVGRGEVTVKRRSDERADEVRVMTVHGAKGLQAPIVILPDTARRQEAGRRPELVPLGDTVAWSVPPAESPPALAEAEAARRARLAAENRRLLYVALTRAESWLVVAGAGQPGTEDDASWHASVAAALDRLGAGQEGDRRVLAHGWSAAAGATAAGATAAEDGGAGAAPAGPLPLWAASAPPPPPPGPRIVSPSDLGGAHALPGEPAAEDPLARGARLHLLLEGLAGLPAGDRASRAAALLPGAADLGDLLAEAAAVLDAPPLARLFGPAARAEVAVAAPLGPDRLLGRIDRLLVEPDRVLAVDFKSNRAVPARPSDVPEAILRQMGAYAAALAAIYPGRRIETAIVWTAAAALMPLPAALTAAALDRARSLDPPSGDP